MFTFRLLLISHVHLYLTVPFVLSWSLLEAMASKTPIVASNTAPVSEFLINDKSALLVDFFDVARQVEAVCRILDNPPLAHALSSRSFACASS